MFEIGRLSDVLPEMPATLRTRPPEPAAPYTLPHLIRWLETRDPTMPYDWQSHNFCLLGQYQTFVGQQSAGGWTPYTHALANFGASVSRDIGAVIHTPLSKRAQDIASTAPLTFGAALQRAKEVQATWQN